MIVNALFIACVFAGCLALCGLAVWRVDHNVKPDEDEDADTDWWRAVLVHEHHYRGVHRDA